MSHPHRYFDSIPLGLLLGTLAACSGAPAHSDSGDGGGGSAAGGSAGASGGGEATGGRSSGAGGAGGYDCDSLDCDDGDVCTQDTCTALAGCAHEPLSETVDVPADGTTLTVPWGSEGELVLTAFVGDVDVSSCVSWTFSDPELGSISAGVFTGTATRGGVGTLTAQLGDISTTARLGVRVLQAANSGSLTEDEQAALDGVANVADPSLGYAYPENGTVFPLDALPPLLQWSGTSAGDLFKLTLSEQYYEYTDYLKPDPAGQFEIPEEIWERLGASGQGGETDPVAVTLSRRSGATIYAPVAQTWRIAQGRLPAVVIYRELDGDCGSGHPSGRTLRASHRSDSLEELTSNSTCNSCHSVSRDGRNLLNAYESASPFDLRLTDLTTTPPTTGPAALGADVRGTFSAMNPDASIALVSNDISNGTWRLSMRSLPDGTELDTDVLGSACAEPAWSPNGQRVAAICDLSSSGGWAFDAEEGVLTWGSVDATDGFTVLDVTSFPNPLGAVGRPSYPNFSPGSDWLIYSRTTAGSRSSHFGRVWLFNLAGSSETRLTFGSTLDKDYYPTFAPFRSGGYYWVTFTSRRPYGNVAPSEAPRVWVAALAEPGDAPDPSRPAFFLRAQRECAFAYEPHFARTACLDDGAVCELGVDCCSGRCTLQDGAADPTCAAKAASECAVEWGACQNDSECCASQHSCVDGFCQHVRL